MTRPNPLPHLIDPTSIGTLPRLLAERARRTPDRAAYKWFDAAEQSWKSITWRETQTEIARWRAALAADGLRPGDTIGIMLVNSREWIFMEQAALSLGLVVVPFFTNDRAENVAYILRDANIRVLLVNGSDHLAQLQSIGAALRALPRIVSINRCEDLSYTNLRSIGNWLPATAPAFEPVDAAPDALASIVYTSGTTGRPKGVMLSHKNILSNAFGGVQLIHVYPDDLFLSFLPLSHMLERTLGYYIPMMAGACVAFARSIPQLGEDLRSVRPSILISVPRIYERVQRRIDDQLAAKSTIARSLFAIARRVGWRRFEWQQGRRTWTPAFLLWPVLDRLVARKIMQQLGGRLRVAICGGAPLSRTIAQTFIGLGLPLIQGYGLTETSPIISGNPMDDNIPDSVGVPLQGVEIKLGDRGELLTRGDSVMLGYWNNPEATRAMIDADGWLHTGDLVRIERSHIFITGRLKEIIVLANGEKIPPADMEMAIAADPLFEQVMVLGEGKPYLCALVALNADLWRDMAPTYGVAAAGGNAADARKIESILLERIAKVTGHFPGYAQVRRVCVTPTPWTVDDGLITSTLKLRRDRIVARYDDLVQQLYAGH